MKDFKLVQTRVQEWSKRYRAGDFKNEVQGIQVGMNLLDSLDVKRSPRLELSEQPFDRHLLALSPLFRRSRKKYLESGGAFRPAFISTSRSLDSSSLLSQVIEYNPIGSELYWTVASYEQESSTELENHLMTLRGYASNLFHEQSHRLLWKLLPPPSSHQVAVGRYLNFAESLVIATDMALGDELGPELASLLFQIGVIYDAGADTKKELIRLTKKSKTLRQVYRQYLQAAAYATYLGLELYSQERIMKVIQKLYPLPGDLNEQVVKRTGRLDELFINLTNPAWQEKHWKKVADALSTKRSSRRLCFPEDPLDHSLFHHWSELWFKQMGF